MKTGIDRAQNSRMLEWGFFPFSPCVGEGVERGERTIGGTCRRGMLAGGCEFFVWFGASGGREGVRGGGGWEVVVSMIGYAPGGVMFVATANALNVEWPPVCQED